MAGTSPADASRDDRGDAPAYGHRHAESDVVSLRARPVTESRASGGPASAPHPGARETRPVRLRRQLTGLLWLGLGLGAIVGYNAVGLKYYGGFLVPQGYGMYHLLPQELAHSALFFVFGLVALISLALAFERILLGTTDSGRLDRLAGSGHAAATAASLLILVGTVAIARYVLQHAVITDDEHVYRFIAQTLRTGALTAPSPASDLEFFREQFVVLTEQARYGKYPIGHPMLLAAGQILGAESLVVPLITALVVLPLFWLGSTLFGRRRAALALLLFACSPQVLLTGATFLSQPTSALCLVSGLGCLIAAETRSARRVWLAAAGAVFGYGVLVRPLPGLLFALAATVYVAVTHFPARSHRERLATWAAFLAPLALAAGLIVLVNQEQTGAALVTGYHEAHAPGEGAAGIGQAMSGDLAIRAMSLAGNLLRLNFWLLGWPISLAFCAFARRTRRANLLWVMIGAAWFYRLIAPKTGVGTVGPIYLFEVVPLLCLLTADGMAQVAAWVRPLAPRLAGAPGVAAVVLAGVLVNLSMFVPVKLANLGVTADAQLVLPRMVGQTRLRNALVFHDVAVPPLMGLSWAYFPRCNSPRLDDDILYVRLQRDPSALQRNVDFWKRRFPLRTAWYFGWVDRRPILVELEAYVAQAREAPETRTSGRSPATLPMRAAATPGTGRPVLR